MLAFTADARLDGLLLPKIESWTVTGGRRVQDFIPARGDGNEATDMGRVPLKIRLSLIANGTPQEATAIYQELVELELQGGNRVFVHPVEGRFVVKMSDLNRSVDHTSNKFEMTLTVVQPFVQTAIVTEDTLQHNVDAEIEALAQILGQEPPDLGTFEPVFVGEPPDLGEFPPVDLQDMSDRTNGWTSETSPDDMNRDIEGFFGETRATQQALSDQNSNDAYAAYTQLTRTMGRIIGRARTLSDQDRLRWGEIVITVGGPLEEFVTREYGQNSLTAYPAIIDRSKVSDPSWIQPGTVLQVPDKQSLQTAFA